MNLAPPHPVGFIITFYGQIEKHKIAASTHFCMFHILWMQGEECNKMKKLEKSRQFYLYFQIQLSNCVSKFVFMYFIGLIL